MNQRFQNLNYLFHPESIAFIGATETPNKWGFLIFNILLQGGWKGKIYPVHPTRDQVLGYKAYPSVSEIPDQVDLAVFTIPAKHILHVIDECVKKGIKAGLVITAGFKETGGENVHLEKKVVEKARAGNMIIAGPNCQGLCTPGDLFFPWMATFYVRSGAVALASQSGNILNMLIDGVVKSGIGISRAVSSGNEADIKIEDYFEYFADDPKVEVLLSYMEGLSDPRRFIKKVGRITPSKPVIILKGGRSKFGANAAGSHTGAMAVPDNLFTGMCRQNGIILSDSVVEAGYLAASFVNRPLPKGNRVAIITGGGGLGVLASDKLYEEGLELVKFSRETLDEIGKVLPDYWVPGNPVDMVAGLDFFIIIPIIEAIIKSGEIDSLIISFISPPATSPDAMPPEDAPGVKQAIFTDQIAEHLHLITDKLLELSIKYETPIYPIMNLRDSKGVLLSERQGKNAVAWGRNIDVTCSTIAKMHNYYLFRKRKDKEDIS